MVFSSIQPAYLDHSSNWQHQQQNHQLIGSSSGVNSLIPPPSQPGLQPSQPPPQPHGAVGAGSIRPGSMAERARMANLSMEMAQQKCPRCESPNTKFCYFNNYSLSQPRHFCKNCRRYWTRGGALRNVPVGGGCRRNKRSKSTSSKSTASQGGATSSSTASGMSTNSGATPSLLGLTTPNLSRSFMSPLGQLSENFNNNEMGLNNYNGISSNTVSSEMNFHSHLLGGGNMDMWRLQQQFPFLGGSDSQLPGIYGQFQGGDGFATGNHHHQQDMRSVMFSSAMLSTQMASVKMEDNAELNISRQLLGAGIQGNDQWNAVAGVAGWTDISSFSSSSTSNPL